MRHAIPRFPQFCRKKHKKKLQNLKVHNINVSKIIFDYLYELRKIVVNVKLINHKFITQNLLARLTTRLSTFNISMKHL